MIILVIDSSGRSASVGVVREGILLYEVYMNCGLTHSKTLVPMCEQALAGAGILPDDVDLFAVTVGPGSFTGIRIGVSAAKGMAWATGKPCAGISSLEAVARNYAGTAERTLCVVSDARGGRIYTALFSGGIPERLTDDLATDVDTLAALLKKKGGGYLLLGDGAKVCYNTLIEAGIDVQRAPEELSVPRAAGIGRAAVAAWEQGLSVSAGALAPVYLRRPQAETERLKKMAARTDKAAAGDTE